MKKKALVICTHVPQSKRIGGFHHFALFLQEFGFDIDWWTLPMHLGWLISHNDRANPRRFFDLWRGKKYSSLTIIRNFAVPCILPGAIEKKMHLSKYALRTPKWSRARKKLDTHYDVILAEAVACPYAEVLRKEYPDAIIIYRPSDILKSLVHDENSEELERRMSFYSDATLCVDDNSYEYYKKIGLDIKKLHVLKNPLSSYDDIEYLKSYTIKESENRENDNSRKKVVYVGVSFYNEEMVEAAARMNSDADFLIIGPFDKRSHDNISYCGSMGKKEFEAKLIEADVAIAPIKQDAEMIKQDVKYGYTGKIISYMKFLLPIVATCTDNYMHVDGLYNTENEGIAFATKVKECLDMTYQDRMRLKPGYLMVLNAFTEEKCKELFRQYIK